MIVTDFIRIACGAQVFGVRKMEQDGHSPLPQAEAKREHILFTEFEFRSFLSVRRRAKSLFVSPECACGFFVKMFHSVC